MKCYQCKKRKANPLLCIECSSKNKIATLKGFHFSNGIPKFPLLTRWRSLKFRLKNKDFPIRWTK